MPEVKKIATRDSYGNELEAVAEQYPNMLVLDADLTGATKTCVFGAKHPERHINCGIAESNMMGVAAGMATMGYIPVVSSFAMFAAGRAFEQVRNSIGYPHLNVKICATHGGISVGEDGATHQCNEDFALMRIIPGMTILSPSDDVEARAALRAALDYKGPVYIRYGRLAVEVIHDEKDYTFTIGKGRIEKEGSDVSLIATGICVQEALKAAVLLEQQGINAQVINISTIKPLDTELIVNAAKKTGKVVTVEEHTIYGGLGSAVCETLSKLYPCRVKTLGIQDVFGESGKGVELLHKHKIDAEGIAQEVTEYFKMF